MNEPRECPACAMPTDSELPECEVCGYEFPAEKASFRPSAWGFIGLMLLFAFPLLRFAGCVG